MPAVSVVVPTYNHSQYVLQALDSAFAQTFGDYEVIVVNDGSPDDTQEVLGPLVTAGQIRYIEQANHGQAAARNVGIAAARGEFIALLDDDDLWPPDKLEWQVEVLRSTPEAVLVYGSAEMMGDQEGGLYPLDNGPRGWVQDVLRYKTFILSPGQALIRRQAIIDAGGFDESIWGADDWDLYIRMARTASFEYRFRTALKYRLHASNASRDQRRLYDNVYKMLVKNYGPPRQGRGMASWVGHGRQSRKAYFAIMLEYAGKMQAQGEYAAARKLVMDALRLWPIALRRPAVFHQVTAILLYRRGPLGLQESV